MEITVTTTITSLLKLMVVAGYAGRGRVRELTIRPVADIKWKITPTAGLTNAFPIAANEAYSRFQNSDMGDIFLIAAANTVCYVDVNEVES